MAGIKTATAGYYHTLIVKENGELWTFGYNYHEQLGHTENKGTSNPNPIPKQVMTNVRSVSGGGNHTLVVKENSELWSFGYNYHGQLGFNENSSTANGSPKMVMTNVKKVSTGYYHTLVIKSNGGLWSFGEDYYGQLGQTGNKVNSLQNTLPTLIQLPN